MYSAIKFLIFHFLLFTIYYLAFSVVDLFDYNVKLWLIFFLLILIDVINYKKIKERLFENSMVTLDFIIYDIISIWRLMWIILLYFGITFSIIIIYIMNYWERDLIKVVNEESNIIEVVNEFLIF